MRRVIVFSVFGLGLLAGPALAAGTQSPSLTLKEHAPAVTPPIQKPRPPRPLFYLFGIPVVVDAPVAPPYCNCAYRLVAGQPATGADAATGVLERLGQ
jgi:hypothetical protein